MKSNYEHFVLTASCLKADLWSAALHHVQGRPALIFRLLHIPTPRCQLCQTASNQQLSLPLAFDPISVPGQQELGTKFPPGDQTAHFWTPEFVPQHGPRGQAAALQDLPRRYLHRPPLAAAPWGRAGPAARTGTATLSPCPRRELQAQTAPTQPSARIQSTAGGIRGFRRLIAEFTFIQSVCVRGERRGLT